LARERLAGHETRLDGRQEPAADGGAERRARNRDEQGAEQLAPEIAVVTGRLVLLGHGLSSPAAPGARRSGNDRGGGPLAARLSEPNLPQFPGVLNLPKSAPTYCRGGSVARACNACRKLSTGMIFSPLA